MTADEQPAVACLGSTAEATFPLVLVFGREFNNRSANVVRGLGQYCFRCSPASNFWNRAYGFLGRAGGKPELKAMCRQRGASPLAFSNVLPCPIPNEVAAAGKSRHRRDLDPARVTAHLDHVFSLVPVITRVELVIVSGADGSDFEHGRTVIGTHCERRRLLAAAIPYLGSRDPDEAISAGFTEPGRTRLREILTAFDASAPKQPALPSWNCAECSIGASR